MKKRDVTKLLSDTYKDILFEHGFKFSVAHQGFTKKISSEHSESVYFVVSELEQSKFEVQIRFNILFSEVEKTWNEIDSQPRKIQWYDFTLQEFSDEFRLQQATWHVEPEHEKFIVDASVVSFINESMMPWFQSIRTIRDARDWIANDGPFENIEKIDRQRVLVMDYLLDDKDHCARFLDSFKKLLESCDQKDLDMFETVYEPYQNFAPEFFKPVIVECKKDNTVLKTSPGQKNDRGYPRTVDLPTDEGKSAAHIYDVFLFLGSPEKGNLNTQDGWRDILGQLVQLSPRTPTHVTTFSGKHNNGKRLLLAPQTKEKLEEVSGLAATTISQRGIVQVSAHEESVTSPTVFLCCATQNAPSGSITRFDPVVVLAILDETSRGCNDMAQSLVLAISSGISAKLSANQKRPFAVPNIIGGYDSLLDAPLGIFKPGNRHQNKPTIDLLRGDWQLIPGISSHEVLK